MKTISVQPGSELPSRTGLAHEEKRRGGAAVEFALVAPLFGIIIVGMFEMSRVVMVKMALDDAARKGARTGVMPRQGATSPAPSATGSNITADVINILQDNKLDPTQATISVTTGTNAPVTYSVSGSAPTYTATKTGGPNVDPLIATTGTKIQVGVSMPVSSFSWGVTYYISGATVTSESMAMVKQ